MIFDSYIELEKASKKLAEIELKFSLENINCHILWIRSMFTLSNSTISRHTHSSFEFHYIYKGSFLVTTDTNSFIASEGSFYLTKPGLYHEQKSLSESIELCMNCDLEPINDNHTEAIALYKIMKNSDCESLIDDVGIMNIFLNVLAEGLFQKAGFLNVIKCKAGLMLTLSARCINKGEDISNNFNLKTLTTDSRITLIENYIKDNIFCPITVKDMSDFLYLSQRQVNRIVYKSKGISSKELISKAKLSKAKDLLITTDQSIKHISESLGFSSVYYFSQFFKREEGYSPSSFRYNTK